MSNYEKLYFKLFAGMSNLVEDIHPLTQEARALRADMIELMRQCEDHYIDQA